MEHANHEWARLAPDKILVATESTAFLIEGEGDHEASLTRLAKGPVSLAVSRRLLDGAIGAAQRLPVEKTPALQITARRWAFRLAGYFHTTHATPRLMREAAARFASAGRDALASWAEGKTRDERGHDELALRDLAALGYDARALVAACVPETAAALVRFFEACVHDEREPARVVGYAYALERLAATRTHVEVRAIEASLPAGINATRCLRVHSAAGSDVGHVEDIIALVARSDHDEREAITSAAYDTTRIGREARAPLRSDDELEAMLAPFRVHLV